MDKVDFRKTIPSMADAITTDIDIINKKMDEIHRRLDKLECKHIPRPKAKGKKKKHKKTRKLRIYYKKRR